VKLKEKHIEIIISVISGATLYAGFCGLFFNTFYLEQLIRNFGINISFLILGILLCFNIKRLISWRKATNALSCVIFGIMTILVGFIFVGNLIVDIEPIEISEQTEYDYAELELTFETESIFDYSIESVFLYPSDYEYETSLAITNIEQKKFDGDADVNIAITKNNLGILNLLQNEPDFNSAITYFNESTAAFDLYDNYFDMKSMLYANIGSAYLIKDDDTDNFDIIKHYYDKAISIKTELIGENDINLAKIYCNYAMLYHNYSENHMDYPKAIEYYNMAIKIQMDNDDTDFAIKTCNQLSWLHMYIYKDDQAGLIECLEKIVSLNGGNPVQRYRLGIAYANLGNYDDAIEYLSEVEKECPTIALPQYCLGNIYYDLEDWEKSIIYHEKAYENWNDSDDLVRIANALMTCGKAYYKIADSECLNKFNLALDLYLDNLGKYDSKTGLAYYWIGYAYYRMKNNELALEAFSESLDIFCNLDDEGQLAIIDDINYRISGLS